MARKKKADLPEGRSAVRPPFDKTRIIEAPASKPLPLPDWFIKGTPKVPNAVLFDSRLTFKARMVAALLYQTCRPGTGEASGDQTEMARRLGLNKETLILALDELWGHRVIYDQVRMRRAGGGYYLVYFLQRYPVETLREATRPRLVDTRTHAPKPSPAKKRLAAVPAPSALGCGKCLVGWLGVESGQGVRPCPTCRPGVQT